MLLEKLLRVSWRNKMWKWIKEKYFQWKMKKKIQELRKKDPFIYK